MFRRAVLPWLAWLAVPAGLGGCARPTATAAPEEDPQLLQEVIQRQERRVVQARTEVAQLERELRMVQMRRRMLERAGRLDLALALESEEHALEQRLAAAQRVASDEEDALAIYHRQKYRGVHG